MSRLLEILISLVIVAAIFLIVALILPSKRALTESVETNRRVGVVHDTVNSFRRFGEWNAITLRDPGAQLTRSGPEEGVGAKLDYRSNVATVGNGSWEIVESVPGESVTYAINDTHRGSNKRSKISLEITGRGMRNVEITQDYRVDYGWDLLGRYAGLYVSGNVGDDLRLGLDRLSAMLASVPNVDYNEMGPRFTGLDIVDRPVENLLVVNAGSIERKDEALASAMKSNMEWIRRTMDANNLVAAGPMRIQSTEVGRDNYAFDVVQPVRRRGGAAATTSSEEGDNAAPVVADAGPELTGLTLQGPVKYERTEATRAVTVDFGGYWAELENARNAMRAWAMTRGHEVIGRPYEDYIGGIDAAFSTDGKYKLYWDLKP
ncbi:MAG: polyketide cyclase [Pseudoxanthomonas suwonensis]|nr:polyketide cyclase [Pseudoxanthomonas suwonensis]